MTSEHHDDPYTILSVPSDATITQIKSSYRKLALKHHPDKGGDESTFKEISAAYEILSDEGRRAEYDHAVEEAARRRRSSSAANAAAGRRRGRTSSPNANANANANTDGSRNTADPFDHPFFRRHNGGGGQFSDPFEMFDRVFREEFGRSSSFHSSRRSSSNRHGSSSSNTSSSQSARRQRSADPFDDPFVSSSGMMGGLGTRGGGMESMMSRMSRQMDEMSSMMDAHSQSMGMGSSSMLGRHAHQHQQRHHQHHGSSSLFSMSSSSMGGGGFGAGQSVTTSTTTRIVNGVKETVTERTVHHPDGRVERHVGRSSGSGRSRGGGGRAIGNDRHRRYIQEG